MARGGSAAASSRGRGKFRNFTRGGGKNFSRNAADAETSMWGEPVEDSNEKSSEEEEEEEEEDGSNSENEDEDDAAAEASREARKAEKKARKEAALAKKKSKVVEVGDLPPSDSEESDIDLPANPNRKPVAAPKKKPVSVKQVTQDMESMGLNRKEREAAQAAEAKARYQKLHEQGKTDEAKNDMARLKIIREKRAAEAAQRLAEKEEREAQEAERKKELDAREAKRREAALGPIKKSKKSK